jgi:hypothetical protein
VLEEGVEVLTANISAIEVLMFRHPVGIAIGTGGPLTGEGGHEHTGEEDQKKGEKESFEFHCAPTVVILKVMLATDLPLELLIPLSFLSVFVLIFLYID